MLLQNFGGKNKPEKSATYPSGVCIHIPVAFLFNYFSYHNGILSAALFTLSSYLTGSHGKTLTSSLSASDQWASHCLGNIDLATDGGTSEHGCCLQSFSWVAVSQTLSTWAPLIRRRLCSKWIAHLCSLWKSDIKSIKMMDYIRLRREVL